jgi:hypothetical protein
MLLKHHDQGTGRPMTPRRDNRSGGSGVLLGAGSVLLLVACCALGPLVLAGGTIAGLGGILRNPWVITAGVVLLSLAAAASIVTALRNIKRHRGKNDPDCCAPTRDEDNPDTTDEQDQ